MEDERQLLSRAGMRITAGRIALLGHVRDSARAQSAAEIRQALGGDLVTVYRNLSAFVASGLVREVRLAGTAVLFEDASLHHHHHAICSKCGKVAELPGCPTVHSTKQVSVPGFARVTGHTLEYSGICNACA